MPPAQPPSLLNLTSILTHLLPPTYPLPADLLSTPLKTRQIYLPPPQDRTMHDAYISLDPGSRSKSTTREIFSGAGSSSSEATTLPSASTSTSTSASTSTGTGTRADDEISHRLHLISQKLRDLQESSVDVVQGESPESTRWVGELLYGVGQVDADADERGDGRELERVTKSWVGYQRKDRETLLARIDLRGLPVGVGVPLHDDRELEVGSEHVEVFLLHEPAPSLGHGMVDPVVPVTLNPNSTSTDVGAGAGPEAGTTPWKLFDVKLVPDSERSRADVGDGWSTDLSSLQETGTRQAGGMGGIQQEGEDGEPESMGADDFWGGYDDDDEAHAHQAEVLDLSTPNPPSYPSFPTTQLHPAPEEESDPYWQSYNSVEDGLRPSNPPTPGGYEVYGDMTGGYYGSSGARAGGMTRSGSGAGSRTPGQTNAGQKDYWGTGGETPVGWSVPGAGLRVVMRSRADGLGKLFDDYLCRSPPVREAPLPSTMDDEPAFMPDSLQPAPVTNGLPLTSTSTTTTATATETSTSTTSADLARTARQDHLRSALRALKGMYGGGEEEWDQVVREFASK